MCQHSAAADLTVARPDLHIIGTMTGAGAHLVALSLDPRSSWERLPTGMQGLTQLSRLSFAHVDLSRYCFGEFFHLPRQLQQLDLSNCSLNHSPYELCYLTQLIKLSLRGNHRIEDGFGSLPPQLQQLDISSCNLTEVPAELAGLAQLSELSLGKNSLRSGGGWQHLPRQLQRLDLSSCELWPLPAELSGFTQLSKLSLSRNPELWPFTLSRLPRQLQQLDLSWCRLQQVPAELAGLTQLWSLCLECNHIAGGWQHLPPQLSQQAPRWRAVQLPAGLTRVLSWVPPSLWVPAYTSLRQTRRSWRAIMLVAAAVAMSLLLAVWPLHSLLERPA